MGWSNTEYYAYLQINWRENFFTKQTDTSNFQMFWDKCLYDGVYEVDAEVPSYSFDTAASSVAAASIAQNYKSEGGLELALYQKVVSVMVVMPTILGYKKCLTLITKATWDNYLTISMAMANELGIEMAEGATQLVSLNAGGQTVKVPVLVQLGKQKVL